MSQGLKSKEQEVEFELFEISPAEYERVKDMMFPNMSQEEIEEHCMSIEFELS